MFKGHRNWARFVLRSLALLAGLALVLAGPAPVHGKKKKEEAPPPAKPKKNFLEVLDYSKIVWPNPPAITRIKYLNFFSGEKPKPPEQKKEKKGSWMDRLAGVTTGEKKTEKPRFQLVMPYGMAVDSKGRLYIADRKVSAIFVVNPETGDFEMIKNGTHARFKTIIGLAIDDGDRLFVSDSDANRILVFDPQFRAEFSITEGLGDPGGLAIDNENRWLYVADAALDQVLVYDVDPPFKLLRRIGTGGKKHTLTNPGDFSKPSNVAVDKDGNLYVTDTLNNRVQIFDADGSFIRAFGKHGDGPGYFARPKGIAVDDDGHIWVADAVQDRVQVFDSEGRLLIWMGGHGLYPGQFKALSGITFDKKNNRVFTSEQYPGRVQIFRYISDEEAGAEKARREAEEKKKTAAK
jgi:DNA-binding beta-propeller fold protein YncE